MLRTRLVATTVLVSLVALGGAGVATYVAFTRAQVAQVDTRLDQTSTPIQTLIDAVGSPTPAAVRAAAPGTFVEHRSAEGRVLLTVPARDSGDDPPVGPHPAGLDVVVAATRGSEVDHDTVAATEGDDRLRVRASRLDDGSTLILGESLHEVEESAQRLVKAQVTTAALALAAAAIVGFGLITLGLGPLRRTERAALAIARSGDVDMEVPGADRRTEVGQVATAMNTMLGRIRAAFAERDETEAQLRASEERMRRFVADVSHELRTPLTAVGAYVDLVASGAGVAPADLDRALTGIAAETTRMGALVEELLLLARLDQHRLPTFTDVDLSELVITAVATAHTVDPQHRIDLRVDDVITVPGSQVQLRQVVDNLLGNARTHTPPGTSTAVRLERRGDQAVLTVADDGPGAAPDHATRAFERFYRADESRSRASGGAGLGLAIVAAVVEAHRGTVNAETSPGAGWTVRVTLPVTSSSPTDRQQE